MDLPYHLKTLPPEALDVLRYFGTQRDAVAHALTISDGVGLSERTFGKVIRRLVTKGYIQMDGEQMYRLTDDGQQAVSDLMEVDAVAGTTPAREARTATTLEQVIRRLVLVTPQELKSGQTTDVYVGFHPAAPVDYLDETAEMVVRLSVVNAEPARPQEAALELSNDAAYSKFKITAGNTTQSRLRVQAFQLGPNPDDIAVAGGFHVDIDVLAGSDSADPTLVAYAADITINKP